MVWSPPSVRIRGCSSPSLASPEVYFVFLDVVGRLMSVWYATCISSMASALSYGDTGTSLQSIWRSAEGQVVQLTMSSSESWPMLKPHG